LFYTTKISKKRDHAVFSYDDNISVLAVLTLVFSGTLALDGTLNQNWKLWKETNNKRYFDAEEHVWYEILFFIFL
jgi:hypothetical protein